MDLYMERDLQMIINMQVLFKLYFPGREDKSF